MGRRGWSIGVAVGVLARSAKAGVRPSRCLLASMYSGRIGSLRRSLIDQRGFLVLLGCRIDPGARAARRQDCSGQTR
ncbi:hypothetical protein BDV38DRAFT_234664 [Aspergillus pseudotamarii]|uniref:Uncharacterized protein n=1 Tax=Aspergillus pseudotamarii TaxID=132259 RepID=A0A5N6T9N4_ASPPS|nr:uncharacterized protein BDV38DRAFT_234664 [Aspergillus pseudotamarii]KAE8143084.1 hypothetical protein BDV38DRAFT_234664 [Aspergillus pseudotamarii]